MKPKILIDSLLSPDKIYFETDLNLKLDIPSDVQVLIENVWQDLIAKGKKIWNGRSLRLERFSETQDKVVFSNSVFNYKERIGLQRSIDYIRKSCPELICRGISIGGLVHSLDGKYVFIERNKNSVARGKFGLVGGIVENLTIKTGEDLLGEDFREIKEEIGISKEEIAQMSIHGLVQGPGGNMIFITKTDLNIDSNKVRELFQQRLDDEAKDIVIVDQQDLSKFLENMEGASRLLNQMKSLKDTIYEK